MKILDRYEGQTEAAFYMGKGPDDPMNAEITPQRAWYLATAYCADEAGWARYYGRWRGRFEATFVIVLGFLIYRAVLSYL